MESSFLIEKKIISMCFNPLRDSLFILNMDDDKLDLTEEDLSKNIIIRRFKLLKPTECNINNNNYRKIPKDSYEGYTLYFWELARKIIVIYPFAYIMIYDYESSLLNYHFQCQGKKAYVIRNIVGSSVQRSLFFSAERMRNIYHINYDNLKSGLNYQKLVLPQNETVHDLACHPSEKYIFSACSDSIIRIFDYSNINCIIEVKNGLVDVPLNKEYKPLKNQNEIIKKNNILACITIDVNPSGTFLISGNENGNVYLWDSLCAIKNRRLLLTKERFSATGIFSLKFIKTKQFENLNRFICLTKEGKFFICSITAKEEKSSKIYKFNKLYENSTFNPITYALSKCNIITSNFINISYFNNIICIKWPVMRLEKIIINEKREDYIHLKNFSSKYFFFYDNIFPKINFALSTQMKFRNYEDYIPITNKNNLIFERNIYIVDNFFVYLYDLMLGSIKRILNFSREFSLKSIYPLKFEKKLNLRNVDESIDFINDIYFLILAENENSQKFVLLIFYDTVSNTVKQSQRFDDVIDFVILGDNSEELKYIFLLHKDKQHGVIYDISGNKKEMINIEGSMMRIYNTPFCEGYTVLYRNVLSELKFSNNINSRESLDYKCTNERSFRLDYSEREIDIAWRNIKNDTNVCAISMIEKIVIIDEQMKILFSYKIGLLENPNIISSIFWIGNTLFYSKGNSINYFYGEDNIHQRVFSSDQSNPIISGILSDRYILVSKVQSNKEVCDVIVTTPILNPIEPILIGYLDSPKVDYNIVKEAVTNLFTNQFSRNLIDKLIKRDLKEVAWLFLSDTKSSFQNIDKKVQILNDLMKFDLCLDHIFPNKNLKNEMDLDEIIWKLSYDHSIEYIKNILIGECNILISYGQFDHAMKIIELLSDYPKAINLLLLSASKEEYEKLKILIQAKGCLSFTDNLLINNVFFLNKKPKTEGSSMKSYDKIFDTYKGEPFTFGANQDKLNIQSIKDAVNKINKKNSHISNVQKKILSFGESSFSQFTNLYNRETSKNELVTICSIILQKISQFFGHNNTVYEKNQGALNVKKVDFGDYSVPLSNQDNIQKNKDEEDSIDVNLEEINENSYLTAYFHCDKGCGNILEDITENSNEGILHMTQVSVNLESENKIDENYLWSNVLEEFEPLEYEDKWGRKSPGSHAIKFEIKHNTNLKIKHTPSFTHFSKKFTIEFWLKLYNLNVLIFEKESLIFYIQNGILVCHYKNKIVNPVRILDYKLVTDKWTHISICYKKGKIKCFVNCEETVNFAVNLLEEIGLHSDIIIGNGKLDGDVTEIRIWNVEIPLKFIKENYKSPLPILAENKRKLRMKINKQEENAGKKKFEFNTGMNRFAFGAPKFNTNTGGIQNIHISDQNIPKSNQVNLEEVSLNLSLSELKENKPSHNIIQEFNFGNFNPDVCSEPVYPSFNSILGQDKSTLGFNRNETLNIFTKKDVDNTSEINSVNEVSNTFINDINSDLNNFEINNFNFKENKNVNFDFEKEDFNFEK